jgi:hypothetical protein
MKRRIFVNWLQANVPPWRWEQIWWLAPSFTLLMLPLGTLVLRILGALGWDGVPRATQGLMLLSVLSGLVVGSLTIWSAGEAGLNSRLFYRVQWLARFAVVGPFLTLAVIFWIARIT